MAACGSRFDIKRVRTTNADPATLFGPDEEALEPVPCEFDIIVSDIPGRAAQGQTTVLALEGEISGWAPTRLPDPGQWHGAAACRARDASRSHIHLPAKLRCEHPGSVRRGLLPSSRGQPRDNSEGLHRRRRTARDDGRVQIVGKKATVERPGGGQFPIASDIFSRFANDVDLQALIAMIVAVVGVITLSAAIVEGLDRRDEPGEPGDERSPKACV